MTVSELADSLLSICELDGDTTYVDALLAAARAAVTAGLGTIGDFTSGSVNGKTFTKQIAMNPAQTMAACVRAKRFYSGTESPQVVVPDFSRTLEGC